MTLRSETSMPWSSLNKELVDLLYRALCKLGKQLVRPGVGGSRIHNILIKTDQDCLQKPQHKSHKALSHCCQ